MSVTVLSCYPSLPKAEKDQMREEKSSVVHLVYILAAIATILGLIVTIYVLHNANEIDQFHTLQDLTSQFNANPLFRNIRTSIDRCERLYKGDLGLKFPRVSKGKYDW